MRNQQLCNSYCINITVSKTTVAIFGFAYVQAQAFTDSNIVDVSSYEELQAAVAERKWARGAWAGQTPACVYTHIGVALVASKSLVSALMFQYIMSLAYQPCPLQYSETD